VKERIPEPDPYSKFEDEGIPDLQEGTPERLWAVDPEEAPLPGDRPLAIDDYGTTAEEQLRGEPLSVRLAREVPEEQPDFDADEPWRTEEGEESDKVGEFDESDEMGEMGDAGEEEETGEGEETGEDAESGLTEEIGLGVGSDLDTSFEPDTDVGEGWPAQPEEPSGTLWEEPRPAGRLIAPDEGLGVDTEPAEVAEEVGPDFGGYSAEEAAMRVEPE
jgi:hypothetical protein